MPSSLICVDANLITRLVISPDDHLVQQLWQQWQLDGYQLAAPTLLHYEVTNALYRYERQGLLSSQVIDLSLKAALALPIQLYGEGALHGQALALARRFSLPAAYDAHYLAVAEDLGATFWTADRRLVQAVRPELSWVKLVGEDVSSPPAV